MTKTEKKEKKENLIPAPKCSVLKEEHGFTRVTHREKKAPSLHMWLVSTRELLITVIALDRRVCIYHSGFQVFCFVFFCVLVGFFGFVWGFVVVGFFLLFCLFCFAF